MNNFLTGSSDAAYHADTTHLSSSGLKLLLKDPYQFYQEYVLGKRVELDSPALTEGKLIHALILEPHVVEGKFVVYPGNRRSGREYEAWLKTQPKGTVAVLDSQMVKAKQLAKAHLNSAESAKLISGGLAEHSMVSQVDGVPVKARADYINVEKRYIADVKTTYKATDPTTFVATIEQYQYDLSAALYCAIAKGTYEAEFDFYWVVISKADGGVLVLKASDEELRIGAEKVKKAIDIYKYCKQTGDWNLSQRSEDEVLSSLERESNTEGGGCETPHHGRRDGCLAETVDTAPAGKVCHLRVGNGDRVHSPAGSTSVSRQNQRINNSGSTLKQGVVRMRSYKTKNGTELPMLNLRGKEYLEVKYRLVWFREDHPDWQIHTGFLDIKPDSCIAFSQICNEKGERVATAHKAENVKGFPDFLEKAETGAIGRALALLGYGTQFCADELDEGDRIVDAPAELPKKAASKPKTANSKY